MIFLSCSLSLALSFNCYYDYYDNNYYYDNNSYFRWISFDKFRNIRYLAKSSFGEVHEATWIYCQDYGYCEVILEKIHNSNDKIVDILKGVKQEFIVIITITLKQE